MTDEGDDCVTNRIRALQQLETMDIDVLLIPSVSYKYVARENEIIQKLLKKGVIIIASSGNNGNAKKKKNRTAYPAGYPGVIGVGAFDRDGKVTGSSTKNKTVDVSAPGKDIVSLSSKGKNSITFSLTGTSYAASYVAGAAAMAKQLDKRIDSKKFLKLLKSTSTDAGKKGYDKSYGYGKLNIKKLLNKIDPEK
jgi:subtilisin family serine protease